MLARALALLFLGWGLASCGTKDPGVAEVVPRLDVLRENARMLGVDARQRFLLYAAQADAGTYAKALPGGDDTRIAEPAEGAFLTQDGGSVLLWSPLSAERTRTWWLWRPGTRAGIAFTSRASGDVVHDRALTYVAFTEAGTEGTSLRVMDTAQCTAAACPSRTLLQVPGSTLLLQAGETTLVASDPTRAWLIDVRSSAVTDLGPVAGPLTLSSDGTRYSLFNGTGHLQVFDTATRTLQWERPWAVDVSREGWEVGSVLMTDAKVLVINIHEPPPPGRIPTVHATVTCDATSCQILPGGDGGCWWGLDRTDVVRCSRDLRCGPYGCEYQFTYFDASMRLFSNTTTSDVRMPQPAFSEDLTQNLWLYRGTSSDTLAWSRPEGGRELELQGAVDTNLCTFLPGADRVVFAQSLARSDGVSEMRLWSWDGGALTDLLALPGPPASLPVVRASPTAVYVNIETADRSSSHIVRIRL